jgi:hypothetical protein
MRDLFARILRSVWKCKECRLNSTDCDWNPKGSLCVHEAGDTETGMGVDVRREVIVFQAGTARIVASANFGNFLTTFELMRGGIPGNDNKNDAHIF